MTATKTMPLQVNNHFPTDLFDFSADFVAKPLAIIPSFLTKSYDNIAQNYLILYYFCMFNLKN